MSCRRTEAKFECNLCVMFVIVDCKTVKSFSKLLSHFSKLIDTKVFIVIFDRPFIFFAVVKLNSDH